MPKEYGGDMPLSEMIGELFNHKLKLLFFAKLSHLGFLFVCLELTKKELMESRDRVMMLDEMKVRMECYSERAREGAVSALKQGMLCKMDNGPFESGLCGNFRKLEVD